jgi:hypothetical protein
MLKAEQFPGCILKTELGEVKREKIFKEEEMQQNNEPC